MTTEEAIAKINSEEDFVLLKRFDFSLARVLVRFPDGAPNRTIAQALMITPEDVDRIYADIVERLREELGVEV